MMADMFGAKWVKPMGAEPDPHNVWAAAFIDVEIDLIKKGFKRLSDSGAVFIPTLPEFKALCITKDHNDYFNEAMAEAVRTSKALPAPITDRTVGKKFIKEIYKNIGVEK